MLGQDRSIEYVVTMKLHFSVWETKSFFDNHINYLNLKPICIPLNMLDACKSKIESTLRRFDEVQSEKEISNISCPWRCVVSSGKPRLFNAPWFLSFLCVYEIIIQTENDLILFCLLRYVFLFSHKKKYLIFFSLGRCNVASAGFCHK